MHNSIAKEYMSLLPTLFSGFGVLNQDSVKLTHLQNHVVEFIYMQQRALNLKEISSGLHIAKQQMTNIVRDLVDGGFLVKITDAKDKRAVLVSLTSKGKEIVDTKWAEIYRTFTAKLAKLSEEEKVDLNYALHKANLLLQKLES